MDLERKDKKQEFFEVNMICREDIVMELKDTKYYKLSDSDMRYIARKLGDSLMEMYWIGLEVIMENFKKEKL